MRERRGLVVGMMISLAGMATIYASRITPFSPSSSPNGLMPLTRCSARLASPIVMLEIVQITTPAGIDIVTARHSTISVRSMTEV